LVVVVVAAARSWAIAWIFTRSAFDSFDYEEECF
jgi:hypothetical protein